MHCPALGEASTLTAGARLHVGYDSRVALTWSVAPVDWPPMDAFGRLALCVIGDAAGVSAELLRAINGLAGEEVWRPAASAHLIRAHLTNSAPSV